MKTFQAVKKAPAVEKYPHAYRWYKHVNSFQPEFSSLPGDPSKEYTAYGPETSTVVNPASAPADDDDDDVDLFGSDDEEEDAEAARVREQRLAEYKKKKEGKTKPAAKSMVTLDVKPWDDETDMKELETGVRGIEKDGLVWGASKLVAVGYGIKKLQINLVVEDEKISLDELQQEIEEDEDHVQSTDIVSCVDSASHALLIWTGCYDEDLASLSARSGRNASNEAHFTIAHTLKSAIQSFELLETTLSGVSNARYRDITCMLLLSGQSSGLNVMRNPKLLQVLGITQPRPPSSFLFVFDDNDAQHA